MINGWINIYKPVGISSAAAVGIVKRAFGKNIKVGHTGTLDVEAEGVLPIAIGEATKLVQFLMDAHKTYRFTIKFGATTDTGDKAGQVVKTCAYIPSYDKCEDVCSKFVGFVTQVPPKFSALKINGVPAYKLAREGNAPEMKPREIEVFALQCVGYDEVSSTATYIAEVSKGTYIRTLAEDISLCLQSLGFVIELARTKVGNFNGSDSIDPESLKSKSLVEVSALMQAPEVVLADIPVIHVDVDIAQKVRYGQKVLIESEDTDLLWLEHAGHVLAIGYISNGHFLSARVFNL
jgi:tRNA pseudouridine55 synthase